MGKNRLKFFYLTIFYKFEEINKKIKNNSETIVDEVKKN